MAPAAAVTGSRFGSKHPGQKHNAEVNELDRKLTHVRGFTPRGGIRSNSGEVGLDCQLRDNIKNWAEYYRCTD